ncbi:Uu.00g027890.m01.CDS01 [Anthostomella pinea]|uniref:Uu.00g027890.m01.CDS01 n=1 Tax=Anthostomella pinea TaxID=933095 RepID=A0AAI8YCN1_9PEZI|nr:Uu.00g027890.m01.CDS01 [Anthostomella pinea]
MRPLAPRKNEALRHLKRIADNRWRIDPVADVSYDLLTNDLIYSARDIARLVKVHSEGTKTRTTSTAVQNLHDTYLKYAAEEDLQENVELMTEALTRCMWHFDQTFFFGLMRRHVRHAGSQPAHNPKLAGGLARYELINLDVRDRMHRTLKAQWDPTIDHIIIWVRDADGNLRDFDELLGDMLHEMCHAWMDRFSDSMDERHERWVDLDDGHGEMFWNLLVFVLQRAHGWLGGAALLRMRDEARRDWTEARAREV